MISPSSDKSELQQSARGIVGLLCLQALVLPSILFAIYDGRHRDLRIPLQFSRDALEYLMQAKGTMENGWWWSHPRLSAPWSFAQVAYPSNTNVDQALIWFVSLFTRDVVLCINLSWVILVVASGLIATACLIRVGLSRMASFIAGILFALSPYALFRSTDHFSLVTYLVPVPCAAALLVATGRVGPFRSRSTLPFVIGCALLGFNYVYYAFFGCCLMLAASVVSLVADWRDRAWRTGLLLVATTCVATAINLTPSFLVWAREGKPLAIQDKTAAEAEVYGLKIRHLVSPVDLHTFPPFRRWTYLEQEASFPLETENSTDRLGVVGSVGFLALLWWLVARRSDVDVPEVHLRTAAAGLTLCAVMLGTIGGFGSLFSLLASTDIRAYNRVFPFIHFFSLLAVGLLLDRLFARWSGPSSRRRVSAVMMSGVLILGVYDQGHAAMWANRRYDSQQAEMRRLKSFVATLETRLPEAAMVFQLPVTGFPSDGGIAEMGLYDQVKPYLVSRTLRWSFPAFADSLARWQRHVGELPARQLCAAVRAAGFSAVLIDRRGYEDYGEALLDDIRPELADATIADSERYLAINVNRIFAADVDLSRLPRLSKDFGAASVGLPSCGSAPRFYIDLIGSSQAPFSELPVELPWRGDITITGWAVDALNAAPAADVDVVIEDKVFPTFYGLSRGDVARALNMPALQTAGFTTRIPRGQVRSGTHSLSLRIVAAGGGCYYEGSPVRISVR